MAWDTFMADLLFALSLRSVECFQVFYATRFLRGSLSGLRGSIRMVTEKIPLKRLMVVSVSNAAFSYRGKKWQNFQGTP